MTKDQTVEDAPPAVSPGQPGYVLNYVNPGEPILAHEVYGLYQRIRDALSAAKAEPFADDPEKFGACSRQSGTHILKALNKNAQDHVLSFPAAGGSNRPSRSFPSMNAALAVYAKIIFQPVAVLDHAGGARTLFDHIQSPDELSAKFLASFEAAFSPESLEAVREGALAAKTGVAALYHENFPIIYVPDGQGGDLQLTPVSAMEVFTRFRAESATPEGQKFVRTTRQEVSSQMQNISTAIQGERLRFLAAFPPPMAGFAADIYRYAQGGRVPVMPDLTISELLEKLSEHHEARDRKADDQEGAYYNSNMQKGAERLARWILREAMDWIEEVNEEASRVKEDFSPAKVDIIYLLLNSYRGNKEVRANIGRALRGDLFGRVLKQEIR